MVLPDIIDLELDIVLLQISIIFYKYYTICVKIVLFTTPFYRDM